jgi:hypothetical protein
MIEKDYSRSVGIVLSILGVFALILIGAGITGKLIYDNNSIKDICSSDNECRSGEVCCLFYGENSGVCHEKNMCERILEITKEEKISSETMKRLVIERPNNQINSNMMMIGAFILLVIIISFFFLTRSVIKDEKNYEKTLNMKLKKIESPKRARKKK